MRSSSTCGRQALLYACAAHRASMGMSEQSEHTIRQYGTYSVKVYGHLKPRWSDWFDGFSVTTYADGTTTLVGSVVDQPELYGVISRVRDLGLTLLAVERLGE